MNRYPDRFNPTNRTAALGRKVALYCLSIALLLGGISFLPSASQQANSISSSKNASTSTETDETGLPNLEAKTRSSI